MNLTRARPRIIIRARDPVLRSLILERLEGLGEVAEEEDGQAAGDRDALVVATGAETSITPRETEVLGLLAEGMANKEIAARLSFSTHTAKFHVESLLRKLDAANRAEAVKEGIRRGLIGV
ncbi:MAG: helix-turn-helix transcriptional regulator [Spirochaetia bacterium]|jgi:DNA-binding CsgD family transcriptional regulator